MQTAHRNIGSNRGNRRVWIEGSIISTEGWSNGDRYDRTVEGSMIHLSKSPEGRYKVAGTAERPIIDMTGKWMTDWAEDAESVEVISTPEVIRIAI